MPHRKSQNSTHPVRGRVGRVELEVIQKVVRLVDLRLLETLQLREAPLVWGPHLARPATQQTAQGKRQKVKAHKFVSEVPYLALRSPILSVGEQKLV